MEISDILKIFNKSLTSLFKYDKWLIENDLSEQCITHKLAEHLQRNFLGYNVDCEYNGNIDSEGGKKRIVAVKRNLKENNLIKRSEELSGQDLINRAVFPDVIIHKRGSNENNLCIIEVKKSTNKSDFKYDEIKLSAYTTDYYGNDLKYKLGIFLCIETGTSDKAFEIKTFINGMEYSF
ncbi:hypothetical protein [Maribacter sp. 4G9]|uniref:hypothetical protein n=1 Tax=Maribacter sp. 4G9 TaxID=1889777 RepID=UPI000C15C619|nr:hypothetical protein [Maribacter sp. 4G9]PIB27892.1 hypothetical protein BFP75_06400 [Maribacter sp. 4G9]